MDKETLSNYGWILIITLVLAVILMLASPFGTYTASAIKNIASGFDDVSKNVDYGKETDNMTDLFKTRDSISLTDGNNGSNNDDYIINLNPTDGVWDGDRTVPQQGDEYEYRGYIYCFNMVQSNNEWQSKSINGWGVSVVDKTQTSYEPILESINGKPVVSLQKTFENCTNLVTAPKIPNNINSLYDTFYGCTSLTVAPEIPSDVANVVGTFENCISLTKAPSKLPSGILYLNNTFKGCRLLTSVPAIPSGVTSISLAFSDCSALSVAPEIPNGVTNMYAAFYNCIALTNAPDIPNGVTNMSRTFYGCTKLTTAPSVIPNGVTDVSYLFYNCTSLTGTITINANPTTYTNCLYNCGNSTHLITLTGTSTKLTNIRDTATGSHTQYITIS